MRQHPRVRGFEMLCLTKWKDPAAIDKSAIDLHAHAMTVAVEGFQ